MRKLRKKTYNFLRWSERYTKTDMIYLVKGGGWLTLEKILTTLAGIALAVAFANLIPEDTYGIYKYILSVAGIIGALTLSGMKSAVIQSVAKGNDGALEHSFWETLKWSSFMILASVGGSLYYFLQDNNTLAIGVLFIGIFYPLLTSSTLYNGFLEGKKDFKRRSLYMVFREVLQAAALIVTMLVTKNILWILFVFFFINSVPIFFLYLRTKSIYKPDEHKDPELIRYGKHLSVIKIFDTLAKHIDKVLIFTFLGAGELAIYTFAIFPVERMDNLKSVFASLALPKFSNTEIPVLKKTLPRKLLLLLALTVVSTVLLILVIPYVYEVIFPQYIESIKFAQIYTLGLPLLVGILLTNVLIAHAKQKELYILNISSDVIKIGLLLILLPTYGILGGIIALLCDRFLKAVIPTYFVFK